MPRTRSLAWSELKIGIVSVVALALAAMLIFLLTGSGGFSWQRYSLKTVFTDVAGLNAGSPVRVAGVESGTVTGINFVDDRVEVTFELSEDMQPRITTTSLASLGSVSLLGESAVDIRPSSEGSPIPEWGYVPSGAATGSLTDVTRQASEGIGELTELLQDMRSGKGTVGRLFTDDSLYVELNSLVSAAEQVARNVSQGRGTLGRLANDPSAAKALEASLQNFETVTARIRDGQGTLGKLLQDDALAKSLTSTTTNLDAITGRISRGEGTAGKLLTERELYDRLNAMSGRLDKVMMGLEQGDGTAGALLRDKQLYENMNGAIAELRNLVRDIRADPRKFLNVRVSLF
ncbi:MAG: MCE family protein [Acidimicrobiia bacterium]|nr:MCE family protein [Acidimicrobiia bacterium]